MSTAAIIAIVAIVAVVLGAVVVVTTARQTDVRGAGALSRETRKRDRKTPIADGAVTGREVEAATKSTAVAVVAPAEVAPFVAPDAEAVGVSRRMFFNRAAVGMMSASLGAFGAAVIAFLWKGAEGGFGSKIAAGRVSDILSNIRANDGFLYLAEARAWVTEYPESALAKAKAVYGSQAQVLAGMEAGVVALYQKCPHLGCRVPECKSSQWFECQCHGSQYNRVGEKKGGPAPRGMDRFAVSVTNGVLTIDTGSVFAGPPAGVNTTGQEAEGPHCVGAGEGGH
ncbi:MAG: ubiquinol-cytochrome c reductase iron-sulfur subunit [Actinomycetes bacterium]|jgi:cytochrome b6-f complex iron-sulfur subunit